MTVDQVRAAAKSKAADVAADSGKSTESAVALLRAPYSSGSLSFDAFFLFSRDTKRLARVDLEPKGATSDTARSLLAADLYGTLSTRYGEPESCGRTEIIETCRWRDAKGGNLVFFMRIGTRIAASSVSVSYAPVASAEASGM